MEVTRNTIEPMYYQIRENLRSLIMDGTYPPNSMIPTEAELCKIYDVSRITVRRAVLDLVQEGLLNRGKGKGTFVSESYGLTTMNGVQSFTQQLLGLNMRPSARLLSCRIRKADPVVRSQLQLEENAKVAVISRLRLVNNEPCMVEVIQIPADLVRGIENEDLNQSVYSLLKSKYHLEVIRAKDILEPIIIGDYETQLLELQSPAAGMRTHRLGFDANHRPIEYSVHIIPGKKCTLVFDRTE